MRTSKPRTKVLPPTTLRELFTDGLQTIPALTPVVDKGPPVSDVVIWSNMHIG